MAFLNDRKKIMLVTKHEESEHIKPSYVYLSTVWDLIWNFNDVFVCLFVCSFIWFVLYVMLIFFHSLTHCAYLTVSLHCHTYILYLCFARLTSNVIHIKCLYIFASVRRKLEEFYNLQSSFNKSVIRHWVRANHRHMGKLKLVVIWMIDHRTFSGKISFGLAYTNTNTFIHSFVHSSDSFTFRRSNTQERRRTLSKMVEFVSYHPIEWNI